MLEKNNRAALYNWNKNDFNHRVTLDTLHADQNVNQISKVGVTCGKFYPISHKIIPLISGKEGGPFLFYCFMSVP